MQLCGIPIAVWASDGAGCAASSELFLPHGIYADSGGTGGNVRAVGEKNLVGSDDPGIHGKYRGKRQYIRAGRWCAGGAAAAYKAIRRQRQMCIRDSTYPKKKVSARVVLWLTAVTIAFAVAVVTGITVYHITQEGITGGYEMPDPVGDENTETDDGQEL